MQTRLPDTYAYSLREKSKIDCLNFIRDELIQKLREYFYFEEDLFPDFENRIRYLSNKYQGSTVDKVISQNLKLKNKIVLVDTI